MNKLKIGIIGIGNMGTSHAQNIIHGKCPSISLEAVADTNPDRLEWALKNLGDDVKRFTDEDSLINSGLVDAVIIAVPHYNHCEIAIKAAKKGLHVMVEKPAGVYTKQVIEMNDFMSKTNVTFGIMFNQRTDCKYRKMKEIVESGKLGAIKRVSWIITDWYRAQSYYDSGDWRATWSGEGGGALLNQCPHQLDLLQWICGMPSKVLSKMHFGKWHDIEVEDDVTTYMEYPNGATGIFITSTADAPGTNRFEIIFEKGKLLCENGKLYMWELSINEREWCKTSQDGYSIPELTYTEVETDGKSEQHVGVLNAFAGHILNNTPLIAEGVEGVRGLTLSNAMHLSSFLGKEVEIPFDAELYYEELQKRVKISRRKPKSKTKYTDISGTYQSK